MNSVRIGREHSFVIAVPSFKLNSLDKSINCPVCHNELFQCWCVGGSRKFVFFFAFNLGTLLNVVF